MAERRRLSAETRRDQLINAALAAAAGRDFADVSVRDIANRAGVSEGLLYHYFPTKERLLLAAAERAADTMIHALDTAVQGSAPLALLAGLAAYLDHVQAEPVGWRALLGAQSGELGEVARRVETHSRKLLLRALNSNNPSVALTAALDGWAAFERAACLTWLDQPTLTRETLEDVLLSSFNAALAAAARHDPRLAKIVKRLGDF